MRDGRLEQRSARGDLGGSGLAVAAVDTRFSRRLVLSPQPARTRRDLTVG